MDLSSILLIAVVMYYYFAWIRRLVVSIKEKDNKSIRTSIYFIALGTVIFLFIYIFSYN